MFKPFVLQSLVVLCAAQFPTVSLAQDFKLGEGGGPVSGGAGPTGSTGESKQLEKCDKSMGTLAIVEPQDAFQQALSRFSLPSPSGLIRLMIQQSGCFQVVERGRAMQNLMQERALSASGQLQAGSNIGGGQMATADFILTPEVQFSENNAGGVGAALGGLFGTAGRIAGAIAGGVKFKQAQTTMLVSDARSGIQVAAASGSAEKSDFGLGGLLGGGGAALGIGAYENTNEGKVVAASFLDNYNNIVRTIRNNPSLIAAKPNAASQANANASVRAGEVFNVGDVVFPKIAGVKIYAKASDKSKVLGTLKKSDEMVVDGAEESGMLPVETADFKGYVQATKIRK